MLVILLNSVRRPVSINYGARRGIPLGAPGWIVELSTNSGVISGFPIMVEFMI